MSAKQPISGELATFDDRWRMRFVRLLPASVQRVWEAVTVSEQLNVWFVPVVRIEGRLGGRCSFSWGEPEAAAEWEVTEFEPYRVVQYTADGFAGAQYLRFELEAIDAETRLSFIQAYGPDYRLPQAILDSTEKPFLRPAGDDTSWCPGIMAGYDLACDALLAFIREDLSTDDIREASHHVVESANARSPLPVRYATDEEAQDALVDRYYAHIRDGCPAA